MNKLLGDLFVRSISSGLKRSSIDTPAKWSTKYRVIKSLDKDNVSKPEPWSFKYHPWLLEMHNSKADMNVGQKAAQMGFTELVLNIVFYKIDIEGADCLYVLPSKTPDASDFSSARFDPALELSPHLTSLFSDVKNVGHKRAGSANLYIRGAQSKSGLRSIPVKLIIVDEVDVMNQENIPLLLERTSGQIDYMVWMISTPTLTETGINKYFNLSTKEHYYFKCPCCSRMTELVYPDCLQVAGESPTDPRIIESKYICKECKGTLHHETKYEWLSINNAEWVPEHVQRGIRGFHINQMYSSMKAGQPDKMAMAHFNAQVNPADEQELYNSKLGLTHAVEGAQITDENIDNCKKSYRNRTLKPLGLITMGVDVGKWLHFEIADWVIDANGINPNLSVRSKPRVINFGKVKDFEEIDKLIIQYRVLFVVIDANPEKRQALQLATRFRGMVKLCYYGRGIIGKTINVGKDPSEPVITVDRTSWLDISLGRIKNNEIELPMDIDMEYRSHMKALTRLYEKDSEGNPIGRYVKPEHIEDHYAHARNYNEIALPFIAGLSGNKNIGRVI
jgi:hypothetical protein